MVSFWPWKADESASFEKTLSSLSAKITRANVKLNSLRTRSRRFKVLWTLYASFAYLLYSIILIFVTGREEWTVSEYVAVLGGPIAIYVVRAALAIYYDFRMSSNQSHLDELQNQKNAAIEKFKAATKYNSTQQLLEKYGAVEPAPTTPKSSPSTSKSPGAGERTKASQNQSGWTNVAPPPTANIRRRTGDLVSLETRPQQRTDSPGSRNLPSPNDSLSSPRENNNSRDDTAEFAPNAYSSPHQYHSSAIENGGPNWYNRILDLLLGEDELRASNRIVLICAHCRLVNGQAPPGIKSLEDLGKWRCANCKSWNGHENEVEKILQEAGNHLATSEALGEEGLENKRAIADTSIADNANQDIGSHDKVEPAQPTMSTRAQTTAVE